MEADQCYCIPVVGARGHLLNDPVLIKLADDRQWVPIVRLAIGAPDAGAAVRCGPRRAGQQLLLDVGDPGAVAGSRANEALGSELLEDGDLAAMNNRPRNGGPAGEKS